MSHIASPQNRRSRDTRAALLDAAWELLDGCDGQAPTMAAIADEAGISRRGLYLHFPTRGQLFAELFVHIDDALDLAASLRPVLEASDPLDALDAFAGHIAHYHAQIVGVVRAVDRGRHDDGDALQLWERATNAWYTACRTIADDLANAGQLADPWTPAAAADLMWALMSVEFVDDLVGDRGWTVEQLADRLRVLFRRTLCVDGGPR